MTVRLWPPHWTVTLLAPLVGDEGTLLASAVSICRTRPNGVQRRRMVRGKPRLRPRTFAAQRSEAPIGTGCRLGDRGDRA